MNIEYKTKDSDHRYILFFVSLILPFAFGIFASPALAIPETVGVRIADVTPSSFSVVWMTDVAANPEVEVYADNLMSQRVEGLTVSPMPGGSKAVQAAQAKGVMKVRVSGAQAGTTYYVRALTKDPANSASYTYSALQTVTTMLSVALYDAANGSPRANDLVAFPAYIRLLDLSAEPGLGDLIILESEGSVYPVSAFVGDGAQSPEGILDLNNLFGNDGSSLPVGGSEKITITLYRAGNLATLTHYRKTPQNSNLVSLVSLLTGFFADINVDGKVDDQDFQLFKAQYRTVPNDAIYNPDYNFDGDPDGNVDVRDFSKFSQEYGRQNVQ